MVDQKLWEVIKAVYDHFLAETVRGTMPSFEAAVATIFSDEHPQVRSLHEVRDLRLNQSAALVELRTLLLGLNEEVRSLREENAELQRRSGDLREGLTVIGTVVQQIASHLPDAGEGL